MRIKNLTKFIFVSVLSIAVLSGSFGFFGIANADSDWIDYPQITNGEFTDEYLRCQQDEASWYCGQAGYDCNALSFECGVNPDDPDTFGISFMGATFDQFTCSVEGAFVSGSCNDVISRVICAGGGGGGEPVIASASFVEISSSSFAGLLGWIGNTFTDLSPIIMLAIGLPLAFWFIKKTIGLVKNKK